MDAAIELLVRESDAAFAAGDADRWADCFANDGQILRLNQDAVAGRETIREYWRGFAARFDTSAWEPNTELVEVHGDDAYLFRTYTERLFDRSDQTRRLVRGRLVYFLRRDADGEWRIRLLMNSHSQPPEPIE